MINSLHELNKEGYLVMLFINYEINDIKHKLPSLSSSGEALIKTDFYPIYYADNTLQLNQRIKNIITMVLNRLLLFY